MSGRVILTADEGMRLTDGIHYARIVDLAEGADPAAYYQITEAEYNAILAAQADRDGT